MEDKEFSMLFEVVCSYHPTERDPIGCDGLYIKDVRRVTGAAQQLAEADRAARDLVMDVARSGVEFEDPRVGYVTVQIDRGTWRACVAYLGPAV